LLSMMLIFKRGSDPGFIEKSLKQALTPFIKNSRGVPWNSR
jgi:hypothetical protein